MINKNFMVKPLTWLFPKLLHINIYLFRSQKPYKNDNSWFIAYYFGTILLLSFCWYSSFVSIESYLGRTFFSLIYGSGIIVTLGIYFLIDNKVKIPLDDEFIIKPSVIKKREQKYKNLGFNFTEDQARKIYAQLSLYEFLHSNTSSQSFYEVFISDFGHEHQVQWNITLSQIDEILKIFKRYSFHFSPSLAIRKKLFLSKGGKLLKISSYNTSKSSRNVKNEDYDFKHHVERFDEFMKHFIDKNDKK